MESVQVFYAIYDRGSTEPNSFEMNFVFLRKHLILLHLAVNIKQTSDW